MAGPTGRPPHLNARRFSFYEACTVNMGTDVRPLMQPLAPESVG